MFDGFFYMITSFYSSTASQANFNLGLSDHIGSLMVQVPLELEKEATGPQENTTPSTVSLASQTSLGTNMPAKCYVLDETGGCGGLPL